MHVSKVVSIIPVKITILGGFPWWVSGKESACQCRRDTVQFLGQEDPRCCRAPRPVRHSY